MAPTKLHLTTLVLISTLFLLNNCNGSKSTEEDIEIKVPVAVDTVKYSGFQIDYHSIGRVVSENQVNLLFQSAGQVDSIWVQVGNYVRKDQRLASINTELYETMFTQAQSMYEKAKRDLESSRLLFNSNVISSDQFEMARIGLDNARAAYTQARNSLENAALRAPFPGWVVAKNLNIGDLVAPGAAMVPPFVLADMNHLKVIVPVPEARIGQIKRGQQARVTFKTFPERSFTGKVLRVGLAPKDLSNNYDVEVRLNGDVQDLKLGLIADVHIILEDFEKALVLPLNLIQDDGTSQYVFIEQNGRAIRKAVEIRALSGSNVLVNADIAPGDVLIIKGQNDVKEGALLDIVE